MDNPKVQSRNNFVIHNNQMLLNGFEFWFPAEKTGLAELVEDFSRAVDAEYAKVRARPLSIPPSLAPQLARLKTPQEMCAAVEDAINAALVWLTSD